MIDEQTMLALTLTVRELDLVLVALNDRVRELEKGNSSLSKQLWQENVTLSERLLAEKLDGAPRRI